MPTSPPFASSGKHAVCLAGVPVGALAALATGGKKSAFLATGSKSEQPGGGPMHLFGLPSDTETSSGTGPLVGPDAPRASPDRPAGQPPGHSFPVSTGPFSVRGHPPGPDRVGDVVEQYGQKQADFGNRRASLAQAAEQLTLNQRVWGSSP